MAPFDRAAPEQIQLWLRWSIVSYPLPNIAGTPPNVSIVPIIKAAMNAPRIEPMPPRWLLKPLLRIAI